MLTHEHLDGLADDVLLQRVGNGCEECFALLFHRYFRQVFARSSMVGFHSSLQNHLSGAISEHVIMKIVGL